MNKQLRKIIREEVYLVMKEIGQEDPIANAQAIVKSNEEQVKSLQGELKWKDNDARVGGIPRDERDARVAAAKVAKDRLKAAENELEMAKQAEINAVIMQQSQGQLQNGQVTQSQTTNSQIGQAPTQGQTQVQL